MVRNPAVFLLDEPLSNLDAKLRGTMRAEITKLHKRLDATFIYVTHDQIEAMTMADRIVVMKDGHIQQVDTPQNLYDRPVNMFVAGFIGAPQMNMMPSVIEQRGARYFALFDGRELPLPAHFDGSRIAPYVGRELVIGIRPENFHELPPADIAPENLAPFSAVVELAEPMGSEVHLNIVAGGRGFIARVSPRFKAAIGDEVKLVVDTTNMQLFDKETERSILY